MRSLVLRILKNGLPTAVFLAILGYGMAEFAGIWLAGQPAAAGADRDEWVRNVIDTVRLRLALGMAAWGFFLIALFEVLLSLWRGNPPPPSPPATTQKDSSFENLFNKLLEQAEAKEK